MDSTCPHAGGDLAAGDIESLDENLCITCPVHGFMYALDAAGVSMVPEGTYQLQIYEARVGDDGTVRIVIPGTLAPSVFNDEDF